MNIVLMTLAVISVMCTIFVLLLTVADVCRTAREPELLVFDEPLTEGIDYAEGEEPLKQRAAGEPT
jgi:hypothetical protein